MHAEIWPMNDTVVDRRLCDGSAINIIIIIIVVAIINITITIMRTGSDNESSSTPRLEILRSFYAVSVCGGKMRNQNEMQ